jgi:Xaa-Pro dipeptidase
MSLKRRDFINLSALAAGTGIITGFRSSTAPENNHRSDLQNMIADVIPISAEERKDRIKKAQRLMAEQKIGALLLDAGTSMEYFSGVKWGQSERTLAAIIPASGEVKYVCPGFEESRFREQITIGKDVYVWQEDESPYKQIVKAINDSGIKSGNIGIEERLRFFIVDGVKKVAPQFNYVSADPVTIPCRLIKSAAEIALMQIASDITVAAIKAGISGLKEGMTQGEAAAIITGNQRQLGKDPGFALVLFGEASAFPHGTTKPPKLKKGISY